MPDAPAATPRTTPRRQRAARPARSSGRRDGTKALLALAVVVALVLGGSTIARLLGTGVQKAVENVMTAAAPAAARTTPAATVPSLPAATLRRLDDWRVRAEHYRDNARPSVLAFVADANLGNYADECRAQEQRLAAFRPGLLHAPDRQLATLARRYDAATHEYLEACRRNSPAAWHRAQGEVSAAADEVNLHYNRLLGHDPSAYDAERVLS